MPHPHFHQPCVSFLMSCEAIYPAWNKRQVECPVPVFDVLTRESVRPERIRRSPPSDNLPHWVLNVNSPLHRKILRQSQTPHKVQARFAGSTSTTIETPSGILMFLNASASKRLAVGIRLVRNISW